MSPVRVLPQWSTSGFIIRIDLVKGIERSKSVLIVVRLKTLMVSEEFFLSERAVPSPFILSPVLHLSSQSCLGRLVRTPNSPSLSLVF